METLITGKDDSRGSTTEVLNSRLKAGLARNRGLWRDVNFLKSHLNY
ncbi:hypothetical protein [Arthrobacter sp. FW306-04-A]|nr:hypothetical protein LFT43_15140 [Arthrobacter sp. FW306-04-A]